MGEARSRAKLSRQVRDAQPLCVFCGGRNASETADHYPPRIIFSGKQRPRGLEFGACKDCNGGSRGADQIVALLSRVFPNPSTELERGELGRLMHQAERRNPGLLTEMYVEEQLPTLVRYQDIIDNLPTWHFLKVDGPLVTSAMRIFGAKLGLALHHATTARIVPMEGAVWATWHSNLQAYRGEVPAEFITLCGPGRTLRQGTFSVERQFRYASVLSNDRTLSGHFAVFREAFGIAMIITEDAAAHPLSDFVQPGFLRAVNQRVG